MLYLKREILYYSMSRRLVLFLLNIHSTLTGLISLPPLRKHHLFACFPKLKNYFQPLLLISHLYFSSQTISGVFRWHIGQHPRQHYTFLISSECYLVYHWTSSLCQAPILMWRSYNWRCRSLPQTFSTLIFWRIYLLY